MIWQFRPKFTFAIGLLVASLTVPQLASGQVATTEMVKAEVAQDLAWPQYRGPGGDGIIDAAAGDLSDVDLNWNDNPPKVLWKTPTPLGFSSFAVADGKAITLVARADDSGELVETCVALDAKTGKEIWSYAMSESGYGHDGGNAGAIGNRGGDGPRSTPTIDGDFVYVYDAQLLLVCLNAKDGKLVWKVDVLNDHAGRNITWCSAMSPVIVDDRVIVAGGGAGQSIIALDKRTGSIDWKTGDYKITHATPVVRDVNGQRQMIFFMQSGLVAIDPTDGRQRWQTPFPYRVSSAASPVTVGNLVYCSAGYGVGAGLFEISDAMSVKEIWRKPNRLMNHWSTPVVRDGHLYGLFEFKKYGKAPLQCVELATGEIKWSQRGYGPGNCILAGDKLVVLSDAGELVIVAATPDRYQELSRAKILSGKCWSTPAYSDGKLFVRSTEEGACVSLKE